MTFELQTFPNGITISQPPSYPATLPPGQSDSRGGGDTGKLGRILVHFLLSYLTAKFWANKPIHPAVGWAGRASKMSHKLDLIKLPKCWQPKEKKYKKYLPHSAFVFAFRTFPKVLAKVLPPPKKIEENWNIGFWFCFPSSRCIPGIS